MTTGKTHLRIIDFRASSLNQTISGLDNSINFLIKKQKDYDWYDGLWFLEDSEPIYGLAFIAFQNYINGCIKDLFENLNTKTELYKLNPKFETFEKSKIELIIGLANYIKHKDESKLHSGTQQILDCFDLKNTNEITESAIFGGLDLLSKDWNLFEILKIIESWREELFKHFEKTLLARASRS